MQAILKYGQKCSIFKTLYRSNTLKPNFIKSRLSSNALDINTNVIKDVILYKYVNDRYYKIINICSICQFGFWTYLSIFAYTTLKDVPVNDKEDKWWRKINLGERKYKNTFTVVTFLIGWAVLCVTWMYSLRSVKYLILRKGGNQATIVTYTPTGGNRMLTLGIENLSCKGSRTSSNSQLPIEVKGHVLHYVLDMRGEFTNPMLFDQTVGLKRRWTTV